MLTEKEVEERGLIEGKDYLYLGNIRYQVGDSFVRNGDMVGVKRIIDPHHFITDKYESWHTGMFEDLGCLHGRNMIPLAYNQKSFITAQMRLMNKQVFNPDITILHNDGKMEDYGECLGYVGIAKYLNYQNVDKNPRKCNQTKAWSGHFIKIILDNPIYCGKIAFGRRVRQKVKGTKNEYKTILADDYIICKGKQDAIVEQELWDRAQEKRKRTGVKPVSRIGRDRVHLLTGLLHCPKCGGLMYCNRTEWTKKDGEHKDIYYYYCGNSKADRGHLCDYKAKLRKMDIEPFVVEAIKDLVRDKQFAQAIQERIGVQVDTSKIDTEISNYQARLKEVDINKARLENEMDTMPIDAKFRERKLHDMSIRLDGLYNTMVELEELIEDAKLRKAGIEEESISLENIYKILMTFEELYDIMSDKEQKDLISYLIKEVKIYSNEDGENIIPLKEIEFNFPIYQGQQEVRKIFWENKTSVETLVTLSKKTITKKNGRNYATKLSKEHKR